MEITTYTLENTKIAEIKAPGIVLRTTEDSLNLIGDLYYQGYDRIILHEKNITPEFFSLKTKLAGDILQKFSQYAMPLTIVGDFGKFKSKSLNAFIYESNNGKQINFVSTIEEALNVE